MEMDEMIELGQEYVMNTYGRLPLVFDRGLGSYIWDMADNRYLDLVSGIAVNSLGHGHPIVVEAIQKQAAILMHCSNLYWNKQQIALAKFLVEKSNLGKAFFCNSGAEANEAAIKLARKWGGKDRYHIITMEKSFHGRTLGALAATAQVKYQKDFQPLPAGFSAVPMGDLQALEGAILPETCGIMLEVIQGEGGINVPTADYLHGVQALCKKHNILLMIDEVQTGMGRTGKPFAYQHFDLQPDIIALAKAIGNGFPIGAMLAKNEVADCFVPGDHASTFGGNPLAMAAGLASSNILLAEDFLSEVEKKGAYLRQGLKNLQDKHPETIADIRGLGLMIGCELKVAAAPVVAELLENGVLINGIGEHILRFVPPLTISLAELDEAINALEKALVKCS